MQVLLRDQVRDDARGRRVMETNVAYRVLRQMLEARADPVRAAREAKYLKLDSREVLGTTVPVVHGVAVEYARSHGLPANPDLLDRLFKASLEEAMCAVEFLAAQPAFNRATWGLTERWSAEPDTWALADPISTLLVAGHLEEGLIDEGLLQEWAGREEPFWFRRIALVATTSLNRGLGGPTRRQLGQLGRVPVVRRAPRPKLTVDLLELSIHDPRHFIRLGIGWALRELARVEPEEAADFVKRRRRYITKGMLDKARLDQDGRRKDSG